jgi:hypothetical protein
MASLATKIGAALSAKAAKLEANARVIDDLRAAEAASQKTAAQIAAQVAKIAELEARVGDAALLAADGDDANFNRAFDEHEAAKRELVRLRHAETAAAKRLAETQVAERRNANAAIRKSIERLCTKRKDHAAALVAATDAFITAWRAFHEVSEKIMMVSPGGRAPGGSMTTHTEILQAVQTDLYRRGSNPPLLGGQRQLGAPTVPGAKCPDLRLIGLPDQLPRLVDQVDAANAKLLAALDGEVASPPSPPLPSPLPQPVEGRADTAAAGETAQSGELAALLVEQARLAEVSVDDHEAEKKYFAIVARIAALQ